MSRAPVCGHNFRRFGDALIRGIVRVPSWFAVVALAVAMNVWLQAIWWAGRAS